MMMQVEELGFSPDPVPYELAWEHQRIRHAEVAAGTRRDTLILLEHEAVYTAGTRTEPHERPRDGARVIDVDRGGKITWHGPGQLVAYPIVRLPDRLAVVDHVRRLERAVLAVLADSGIDGFLIAGRAGVWTEGESCDEKIAAIGVRVVRGVTMHGVAINADNDLAPFASIVPCGIADAGVTTMTRRTGRRIAPSAVSAPFAEAFAAERTGVVLA